VTCTAVEKDASGQIVELRCSYDPETRGGDSVSGRKVKATLHWVSARHALDAEVRLYDRLFKSETPESKGDYRDDLNPSSLEVLSACKVEPSVAGAMPGTRYQFERLGYFCVDPDSTSGALVFNRTVTLKDSWAKLASKAG
jgi:glutaminyl-tRNA synthetase